MQIFHLTLNDGRKIEIYATNTVSSKAVVLHHGTPSCALTWTDWLNDLESDGISAIAYSRAGYSTSDRAPGRKVIDVQDDISQVLDHFGIDEFVSAGWSGGGPHALATAFDPRCRGVVVLAGVGMYGVEDLDFLAGMGEDNEIEFGAAVDGLETLEAWMLENGEGLRNATSEGFRQPGNSLFSEPDFQILQGDFAEVMADASRQSAAVDFGGWVDDDIAFTLPWGFEVSDVNVPVHIWQGDQDLMVPAAHGAWLHKHLPMSELHFVPGEGHISIVVNHRIQIVHNLAGLLSV
jgi:pimeloyl-ACP methyl ester carboxylesterase